MNPSRGLAAAGHADVGFDETVQEQSGTRPILLQAGRVVRQKLRLVRPLAQRENAVVWVAEHLALKTEVAVKFVIGATSERERLRLERDLTAAARLRSPHAVQIFDVGVLDEGPAYVVTELLEGEDLERHLARVGRLDLTATAAIVQQVCRALARAHALGIAHGRLAASNVFLSDCEDELFVRVLDFGWAGSAGHAPVATSAHADLWALTLLTYRCLTGQEPDDFRPPSAIVASLPPAIDAWFQSRFDEANGMKDAFLAAARIAPDARVPAPALVSAPLIAPPTASVAAPSWEEWVEQTLERLERTRDVTERCRLLQSVAAVMERELGEPAQALVALATALGEDPTSESAALEIERIASATGLWPDALSALEACSSEARAPEHAIAIWRRAAPWYRDGLGRPDLAQHCWARILELDPNDQSARAALDGGAHGRGELERLGASLWSALAVATAPDERASLGCRIGEVLERLQRPTDAVAAYQQALDTEPGNLPALRGLARLHAAAASWPDLVTTLECLVERLPTARERFETLFELGRIGFEQLRDPARAARWLEQALELEPGSTAAFSLLESCYRRLERWLDLVMTLERHAELGRDPRERLALELEVAKIRDERCDDLDGAAAAYERVVAIDPARHDALEALARIHERRADFASAVATLQRLLAQARTAPERVELHHRIACLLQQRLNATARARVHFSAALELDGAHAPSLGALRRAALADGDFRKAALLLEREQAATADASVRAGLLADLARLRWDKLGNAQQAIDAWREALRTDRDCEPALVALGEIELTRGRWAEALPFWQRLVRLADKLPVPERVRRFKLLGQVQRALGDARAALSAYERARRLDPSDLEALWGVAESAHEIEDWTKAHKSYSDLLVVLGPANSELRARAHLGRGRVFAARGDGRRAIAELDRARAEAPRLRPTLEALGASYAALGLAKQVVWCKRRILSAIDDERERLRVILEIAEVWQNTDDAEEQLIFALEEARAIAPSDHRILHRLLQAHQLRGDWAEVLDVLDAIVALEPDPKKKCRYFFTMAQICRDMLNDAPRAVELFEAALDHDPAELGAFERIAKILTARKDWARLELAYRRMIHRAQAHDRPHEMLDVERTLWTELGIVYRDRLGRADAAVAAFETAAKMNPGRRTHRVMLAEAYELDGDLDAAIGQHRRMVAKNPERIDAYRQLYRLLLKRGSYDEAWCVAAALVFLGKADAKQRRLYDAHRARGVLDARGSLSGELWSRHLVHPDASQEAAQVLEAIAPAATRAKLRELAAYGALPQLDRRCLADPRWSRVPLAKTFALCARALGVPAPELYVRYDLPGAIVHAPGMAPASIAGRTALAELGPRERAFLCAKHLAGTRGARGLMMLFPTATELTLLLCAGVLIAAPTTPLPPELQAPSITTAHALARELGPIELEALRIAVARFMARGGKANLRRWTQAADLTQCRAGLLLCADLETAKRMLLAEPEMPGDLTPRQKMGELLAFFVSEQHGTLRRALRLSGNPHHAELDDDPVLDDAKTVARPGRQRRLAQNDATNPLHAGFAAIPRRLGAWPSLG